MFSNLLVPLDGSARAAAVLPLAHLLGDAANAEITLLQVVPDGSPPAATRDPSAYLSEIANALRQVGVERVRTTVRLGNPDEVIPRLAAERGSDLVVMGTRGRSGLPRAVLGSVADRVLRESPAPVLLLGPHERPVGELRVVLVPLDDQPRENGALGVAVPLARAHHARLVLVRVSVPPPVWVYEPTIGLNTGPFIDPMWLEDARVGAEAQAERVAAPLRADGLAAEARGVLGQVAPAIIQTADEVDADLIVMSTHARSGPTRATLGSVADAVVRRSRRPVLLVRRGLATAARGAAVERVTVS
jgi:nucleotide-binding universal stress UspA family protein